MVIAGNRITWTITAGNAGPSDADDVVITDALPAGVTDVQAQLVTGTGPPCTVTTIVSCSLTNPLGVGGVAVVQVSALVPPSSGLTALSNAAQITSTSPDPNGGNNTATVNTAVTTQALLHVTKIADPEPFVPGRDAVYTIVDHQRRAVGRCGDAGRRHARPDPHAERPARAEPGHLRLHVRRAQLLARRRPGRRRGQHPHPGARRPGGDGDDAVQHGDGLHARRRRRPERRRTPPRRTSAVMPLADLTLTKTGPATRHRRDGDRLDPGRQQHRAVGGEPTSWSPTPCRRASGR